MSDNITRLASEYWEDESNDEVLDEEAYEEEDESNDEVLGEDESNDEAYEEELFIEEQMRSLAIEQCKEHIKRSVKSTPTPLLSRPNFYKLNHGDMNAKELIELFDGKIYDIMLDPPISFLFHSRLTFQDLHAILKCPENMYGAYISKSLRVFSEFAQRLGREFGKCWVTESPSRDELELPSEEEADLQLNCSHCWKDGVNKTRCSKGCSKPKKL